MSAAVREAHATDEPPGAEEPRRWRWTRDDYYRMAEVGLLPPDARVELIDGEVLYMSPQRTPHFNAVSRGQRVLSRVFGEGYWARAQGPLSLNLEMEPEPDLAVVPGTEDDYEEAHPNTAVLVVEVSDTTLR